MAFSLKQQIPKALNLTTAARIAKVWADGVLLYDIDEDLFYVGDGTTAGGIPYATQDYSDLNYGPGDIVPIEDGGTSSDNAQDARAELGMLSTSVASGCELSGIGTAFIQVSAGVGYVVDIAIPSTDPTYIKVTYAGDTNITPLYLLTTFFIDNTGTLGQFDSTLLPYPQQNKRDTLYLGTVFFAGATVITLTNTPSFPTGTSGRLDDMSIAIGPLNVEGNIIFANGANLLLDKTAGSSYGISTNHDNSHEVLDTTTDPALSPIANASTFYAYKNGSGSFTLEAYTGITPDRWDDGSGTPAVVSNNKYTIQRIYFFPQTGIFFIYLGQTEYNSLAGAIAATNSEDREVSITVSRTAILRSSLVVKKGVTSLLSADAVFEAADKFGGKTSGAGTGSTSLQGAYNNSLTPEIETNASLGALSVMIGTGVDTDLVYEGKNDAGTTVFSVSGEGDIVLSGDVDGVDIAAEETRLANTSGTNTGDQGVQTTQVVSGLDIDWDDLYISGGTYTKSVTASSLMTFSNAVAGQIITVRATNTGPYLLTWPAAVKWPQGTLPQFSTETSINIYTFLYDGTDYFGVASEEFL